MARKFSLNFFNDPRKKAMAAAVAVILAAFFYYNTLLKAQLARIKELSPQIRDMNLKISNAERELSNIAAYKKQYDTLKLKIENYKKRFPYENEIPALLEHLSKTAKDSGVKILAIKPVNPDAKTRQELQQSGGLFLEMPIKIEASSGYHQLGVFINKLENSERFVKVNDFKIAGEDNPNIHSIDLVMSTFVLLQELEIK